VKPHGWYKPGFNRFCWAVCRYCGLVKLNNDRTLAAIGKGCDGHED
jgi:hypothetical protein